MRKKIFFIFDQISYIKIKINQARWKNQIFLVRLKVEKIKKSKIKLSLNINLDIKVLFKTSLLF